MNLYEYCMSKPVITTDSMGLDCGECLPPNNPEDNDYREVLEVVTTVAHSHPDQLASGKKLISNTQTIGMINNVFFRPAAGAAGALTNGSSVVTGTVTGALRGGARIGVSPGGAVEKTIDNFLETVKQNRGYSLWLKVQKKACEKCCMSWFLRMFGAPAESGEWVIKKTRWVKCTEGTENSYWGEGAFEANTGPTDEQLSQCAQRARKELD